MKKRGKKVKYFIKREHVKRAAVLQPQICTIILEIQYSQRLIITQTLLPILLFLVAFA